MQSGCSDRWFGRKRRDARPGAIRYRRRHDASFRPVRFAGRHADAGRRRCRPDRDPVARRCTRAGAAGGHARRSLAPGPVRHRHAAGRVFRGRAHRVRPAAGTARQRFPARGVARAGRDPVRRDAQLCRYRARDRAAGGGARGGRGERAQPDLDRHPLPPRRRRVGRADRLCRRAGDEGMAAGVGAPRGGFSGLIQQAGSVRQWTEPQRLRISAAPIRIASTAATRRVSTRSRSATTPITSAVTIPVSRSAASGAVGPSAKADRARP